MSDIDYAAIRARIVAATPGPWSVRIAGTGIRNTEPYALVVRTADHGAQVPIMERHNGGAVADVTLAAHAPTDLAWLLDRVEELEAKVERVQALCDNAPHIRDPWEDDWKGEQVVPVDQLRAALAARPAAGEETE